MAVIAREVPLQPPRLARRRLARLEVQQEEVQQEEVQQEEVQQEKVQQRPPAPLGHQVNAVVVEKEGCMAVWKIVVHRAIPLLPPARRPRPTSSLMSRCRTRKQNLTETNRKTSRKRWPAQLAPRPLTSIFHR